VNPLAVACAALALNSAPFTTTMSTSGHTPKINTKWAYSIKVVDPAGKPIAATISAVVVDPIGGIHPVHLANVGSTPGKVLDQLPDPRHALQQRRLAGHSPRLSARLQSGRARRRSESHHQVHPDAALNHVISVQARRFSSG
jgi:hypothetical protein